MARLGRKGRKLKWAGLVLCLITVIVWAASMRWRVEYVSADSVEPMYPETIGDLVEGHTTYCLHSANLLRVNCGRLDYIHFVEAVSTDSPGWDAARNNPVQWYLPGLPYLRTRPNRDRQAMVPLWLLIMIVALPTAYLWYRDRRRIPPGHCQKCGYNLTGNISGVCPECGAAVSSGSEGES